MPCFAVSGFADVAYCLLDFVSRWSGWFFGNGSTFWRHNRIGGSHCGIHYIRCWRVRYYGSLHRHHWGVYWGYRVCRSRSVLIFVHGEKNATHSNNLVELARKQPS